jgi:hypothetical protein
MSTVTVQLAPDIERKLRSQASQLGQTLEAYLVQLAERAVANATTSARGDPGQQPRYVSDPRPTQAEFDRLLGDLAVGRPLPVLPADFSRADVYDDHDGWTSSPTPGSSSGCWNQPTRFTPPSTRR